MKFERHFTTDSRPVADQIEWRTVDTLLDRRTGQRGPVEIPAHWSQNAADVLGDLYLRKAEVPQGGLHGVEDFDGPDWLRPHKADDGIPTGREMSARQVFHRLAGAWTYHGWIEGYFRQRDVHGNPLLWNRSDAEAQAQAFYDEVYWCLAHQIAVPNSPQFFNTGLWWAYGIEGPDCGMWRVMKSDDVFSVSLSPVQAIRVHSAYRYPQPHACLLTPTIDDLVNEGGIMDTWTREVRIFKNGSGSGINPSRWRGKGEKLSGGGTASGMMSFLRIGDAAAGATQSGGNNRRAAKMICVEADHPEISEFIDWKPREEYKAAAMYVGSQVLRDVYLGNASVGDPMTDFPQPMIDRLQNGFEPVILPTTWEGEAIRTVDAQNANTSVWATDRLMSASLTDAGWELRERTTGRVSSVISAKGLWEKICRAAWACGDPGLLFADTGNAWNTCAADGRIRTVNPCGEYWFLDATACLLASLNLVSFLRDDGSIDLEAYEHVTRLFTVVLDISVSMASFPAKEFAVGAWDYRTLGLGPMNLGGLLMRLALPYDSDEGRGIAAALQALMTGVAYRTSAEMAVELDAFPRWEVNASDMRRVLHNHRETLLGTAGEYDDLSIRPYDAIPRAINQCDLVHQITDEASFVWNEVVRSPSFRNAQVTLAAPTGTIHLLADCDTSGVEPDYALVKHKKLAGGGTMRIVNQSIEPALIRLGYDEDQRRWILLRVRDHGEVDGPETTLLPEHRSIFDCVAELRPMAHVLMVAAIQPFLSGGASKTVNLPNDATTEDVSLIYREAHRLGVKAISLYRDGSKLSQPLAKSAPKVTPQKPAVSEQWVAEIAALPDETIDTSDIPEADQSWFKRAEYTPPAARDPRGTELRRGEREQLPSKRLGYTQKSRIAGQAIYLRTGEYPDGRIGEIFLDLSGAGSTLDGFANSLAKMTSIALQFGAPAGAVVEALMGIRFEPAGFVELHDDVKSASSIPDLVGRSLAISYLGRDDLSQRVRMVSVETGDQVVALDRRAAAIAAGGKLTGQTCTKCGGQTILTGTCWQCLDCWDSSGGCGG